MESNEKQFLTCRELAQKINVPVNTIYYWISKNEIPYIKMGKHNRFDYEEVMKFFKSKMNRNQTHRN